VQAVKKEYYLPRACSWEWKFKTRSCKYPSHFKHSFTTILQQIRSFTM